MNYCEIKSCDIANGEGVRVSLFVAGCTHHCKGCFNPDTWDFAAGEPFTEAVQERIISELDHSFIDGLTLLGGEPFEPSNQEALLPLLRAIHTRLPDKNIWAYSGYVYDKDILPADGRAHCAATDELLSYIDVLVDGPFVEDLKDISLVFRGSSNQRILHIHQNEEQK